VLATVVNALAMSIFYLLMTTMAVYAVRQFAASATGAGLASSMFIVGAVVTRLTGGIVDRAGPRRTLLAALAVFVPQGVVLWEVGLVMGACNVLGAYLGARVAVSRGSGFVRVFFVVVLSAFVLKIGYDTVRQLVG